MNNSTISQHQRCGVELLPGLFPLPQLSHHEAAYGWEMASSKSAIANLLENVDGIAACKRPVDLQIVTLFLQGKQNFIQL